MIYRKHNGALEPLVPQPQTPTKLPVNYVYVQLPGTEFPSVLYPNNTWTEVTFSQSYFHRARSSASVGDTQGYTTARNGVSPTASVQQVTPVGSHCHYDTSLWGSYCMMPQQEQGMLYGLSENHSYICTGSPTYQCVCGAYVALSPPGVSGEGWYNAPCTWSTSKSISFSKSATFAASETRPQNIAYRLWRVTA